MCICLQYRSKVLFVCVLYELTRPTHGPRRDHFYFFIFFFYRSCSVRFCSTLRPRTGHRKSRDHLIKSRRLIPAKISPELRPAVIITIIIIIFSTVGKTPRKIYEHRPAFIYKCASYFFPKVSNRRNHRGELCFASRLRCTPERLPFRPGRIVKYAFFLLYQIFQVPNTDFFFSNTS